MSMCKDVKVKISLIRFCNDEKSYTKHKAIFKLN